MVTRTAHCFCDSCGNTYDVTKEFATVGEADLWERMATDRYNTCPSCYAKRDANKTAKRNNWAERKAKRLGFPQMVGAEKQAAWANTIRIHEYNAFIENKAQYTECGVAFWNYLFMNMPADAMMWIENRERILAWGRETLGQKFIEEHPEFKGCRMKKTRFNDNHGYEN
ncbi:MAG: hypothetical protein IJI14_05075 [Anaerolineaceae bacterium]|nr:hypothetical protein [Anaerolineaceae bacterium]